MSHRYGSRPIPVRIPQQQFQLIMDTLNNHNQSDEIPLIEQWYKLDTNAKPPMYILQSLNDAGEEYLDKEGDHEETESAQRYQLAVEKGRELWREAEGKLASSLRAGVVHCVREGTMTEEVAHTFARAGI